MPARRSLRVVEVDKPRSELTQAERGPLGCTPCASDQVWVPLPGGLRVELCRAAAAPVTAALRQALADGAHLEEIIGYRPGISRGPVDRAGDRTVLSNHAFGTAIDLNQTHNGLYGSCPTWGPGCVLLQGGPWSPTSPSSFRPDHPLVRAQEAAGWIWAGTLEGVQKDFMHFSLGGELPTG